MITFTWSRSAIAHQPVFHVYVTAIGCLHDLNGYLIVVKERDGENEYGKDGRDARKCRSGGKGEQMWMLKPPVPGGTQDDADEDVEYAAQVPPLVATTGAIWRAYATGVRAWEIKDEF